MNFSKEEQIAMPMESTASDQLSSQPGLQVDANYELNQLTSSDFQVYYKQPDFQCDPQLAQKPQSKNVARHSEGFRKNFTLQDVEILEEHYKSTKCLTSTDRNELTRKTGLSERRIRAWYQNKRAIDKKDGLLTKQKIKKKRKFDKLYAYQDPSASLGCELGTPFKQASNYDCDSNLYNILCETASDQLSSQPGSQVNANYEIKQLTPSVFQLITRQPGLEINPGYESVPPSTTIEQQWDPQLVQQPQHENTAYDQLNLQSGLQSFLQPVLQHGLQHDLQPGLQLNTNYELKQLMPNVFEVIYPQIGPGFEAIPSPTTTEKQFDPQQSQLTNFATCLKNVSETYFSDKEAANIAEIFAYLDQDHSSNY